MRLVLIGVIGVLVLLCIIAPLVKKKKPSIFFIILLLIPAVLLGYYEHTWKEDQEKLQDIYRQLTGVSVVDFSCGRMSVEWFDAYVTNAEAETDSRLSTRMKHSTCSPLMGYLNLENKEEQEIDNSFTDAVISFTEAAVRMTNPGYDSTKVRCVAVVKIPDTLGFMGGSAKQAYMVQQHYINNMKNAKLTSRVC